MENRRENDSPKVNLGVESYVVLTDHESIATTRFINGVLEQLKELGKLSPFILLPYFGDPEDHYHSAGHDGVLGGAKYDLGLFVKTNEFKTDKPDSYHIPYQRYKINGKYHLVEKATSTF